MLGNIKDDVIQRRLDELRRDTTANNNDDDDNINLNLDDGDDDDNDDDIDVDDLLCKYDDVRRRPIPKPQPQNYEDQLCRYDRLKQKTDKSDFLRKFDKLKKLVFHDIPPSPPPPLKRKDYSDDEKSLILPELPSSPATPDILQTNFDQPITNLIDKANNVIEMVPKNKKRGTW